MIWAGSAPHHTPSDIINDSYCTPQDWRKSWRPYHARTPCGQLQRQRETAKRLFRHITPSQLCILSVNNSLIRYDTCNMMMTNINFSDTLFFCFFCFLLGLSRIRFQFIRIGDFCRLGSYIGDNTPPSSYSPSCPSQTLQSPSVTSPSDRRRPLGLCQDWVMCEQCWTGTREKKNTRDKMGQTGKPLVVYHHFHFFWERTRRVSTREG